MRKRNEVLSNYIEKFTKNDSKLKENNDNIKSINDGKYDSFEMRNDHFIYNLVNTIDLYDNLY